MTQTDGRAITNPENAQHFSHAEIKAAADQMNPDGLGGAFDAWSAIAAAVTKAGEQFETAVQAAVNQHWEGVAAEQSVLGIRNYATRVADLGAALNRQSEPLTAAASAAGLFKVAVPDVVDTAGNPRGPEQRNSQEEQARDDMNTLYITPYGTTAPGIPTLPPPVNPISATPADNGVAPGGSGTPDPSRDGNESSMPGGTDGMTGEGESAEPAEPAEPDDSKTEGNATESTSPSQHNGTTTTPASSTQMPTSSPSSAGSAAATVPAGVAPAGTVPGAGALGASRPAVTGSGNSGGVPGSSGTPSPGKSVAGTAPGATAAQPAATATGRPGAAGTAGYPGMMPPGARGRRADDNEHKSAEFLRTDEHGEELIGEVQPTVPPVIGAQ